MAPAILSCSHLSSEASTHSHAQEVIVGAQVILENHPIDFDTVFFKRLIARSIAVSRGKLPDHV